MTDTKDSGAASLTSNASPSSLSVRAEVAEHTPGPWWVEPDSVNAIAVESDGGRVALLMGDDDEEVTERERANAARIVAAVNYCEGYGELPGTSLRALEDGYREQRELIRAQRDELAAALRAMHDAYVNGATGSYRQELVKQCEAALAKVTP